MCVLQVLHIFWAGLILRMVIKFLPGNVWTVAFNFPLYLPHNTFTSNQHLCTFDVFFFKYLTWQDIVEDERSDKEETESDEDDGDNREQSGKSKNGHMHNGHTPLNNNHSKTD